MKTEFTYPIRDSLEYAYKGEMKSAEFITMKAPSAKNIAMVAPIKQALTMAIQDAHKRYADHEEKESESDDEMDGISIVSMIEASGHDMCKFFLHFQQLLTKTDLFLIEGEEKMTMPLVESLSLTDLYGLAGDFLKNFILASLMNQK